MAWKFSRNLFSLYNFARKAFAYNPLNRTPIFNVKNLMYIWPVYNLIQSLVQTYPKKLKNVLAPCSSTSWAAWTKAFKSDIISRWNLRSERDSGMMRVKSRKRKATTQSDEAWYTLHVLQDLENSSRTWNILPNSW